MLAATLAACAGVTSPRPDFAALFADDRFPPSGEPIRAQDVFAVDAAMRDYLATVVARRIRREGPLRGLFGAVREDLRIDYDATMTRTAAQTFAARAGNCLSLVILTGAFAKQLGIPVVYRSVYGQDAWTRSNGIVFHSGHIDLVLGSMATPARLGQQIDTPLIVDFLPSQDVVGAYAVPVPEKTVVAMYMNNRAAEILASGDAARAYWWARSAIESVPDFVAAYNTLGLIYLRHGDLAQAEVALRDALARAPQSPEALANLAEVLVQRGQYAEAQRLREELARIEPDPPYYFYDQGVQALARGDAAAAVALFEKELKRLPYDDEVHFALAAAELRLGHQSRAQKQLLMAIDDSLTRERRAIYAAKLDRIESERGR